MFKSIYTKVFLPIVISAFVLTACDKDKDVAGEASVLSSNDTILRYIPADTPYVFASVTPLPEDVMDKVEPKVDQILQSYQTVLREVVAMKQAEVAETEVDAEKAEKAAAFIEEMTTLLSVQGMRDAGIGRDAAGAFYGNGLLPVIRIELTDGKLFDAAVARLEEKAGHRMSVAAIEGGGYRYFDADKIRIVIAILEDQAVFTFVPTAFDDAQTAAALGLTLPETSIADSGVLEEIAIEYGFTSHYAGYIDFQAIASTFIDPQTGVNADLLALMEHDTPVMSDVCKAEIRSLTGVVPRMVLGYTQISTERFDSNVVFELRDDIATGLLALPAAVPGLGGEYGGLMSFGMSLDVKAAREFIEERLDALEAEPFECEEFADVQQGVAGARQALNQPVPPMVYDFKGFLAVIDEIEGLDVATQTPPTSVEGQFLLAMDNAPALVQMGAMFSPDLAQLNLQPDGNAVALNVPQMQAMGIEAFAALTDSALAIAVGEEAEADLDGLLVAEAADPAPFMSFNMDAARYYSFIGDAIAAAPQKEGERAPSPEMQAALQDIMTAIAELYDRLELDVLLTSRGMEIQSGVTLKD